MDIARPNMPTLVSTICNSGNIYLRYASFAVLGSLLLWLSAKIQIPFFPVPMTMQSFVILVLGIAFGPRLALSTVALYLVEGAVGLPVFAGTPEKNIGIAYMLGPTGGYLLGFLFAVFAVGMLARRGWDRSFSLTLVAMTIGTVLIYLPGLAWLGTVAGWDKPILSLGLYPFILGDVVKILLAAILLPSIWHLLGKAK